MSKHFCDNVPDDDVLEHDDGCTCPCNSCYSMRPMKTIGKTGVPLDSEKLRMSASELIRVVNEVGASAVTLGQSFKEFRRAYDESTDA